MLLAPGYIAIFFFFSLVSFTTFQRSLENQKKQHAAIRLRGWLCPFLWRFTPWLRTLSARLHGAGQGSSEQSSPGKSQQQSWLRLPLQGPTTEGSPSCVGPGGLPRSAAAELTRSQAKAWPGSSSAEERSTGSRLEVHEHDASS